MRLRPYLPTDRAACLDLFSSNVPDYFAELERADFIQTLDEIDDYFVIEAPGEGLVACGGYAALDDAPEVAGLCWGMVRRDLQRRGYGEHLLRERLQRIAAEPAFERIVIETTQFSRAFFARHGFVATREVADGFAPGYDLVEMQRPAR